MPATEATDADERLLEWAKQHGYGHVSTVVTSEPANGTSTVASVIPAGFQFFMLLGIVAIGAIMLPDLVLHQPSIAEQWRDEIAEEKRQQDQKLREVINGWLQEQRKGHAGSEFWLKEWWVSPVQLYAVRTWDIVEISNNGLEATVRIASSNKGGIPIEVLWKLSFDPFEDDFLERRKRGEPVKRPMPLICGCKQAIGDQK